MSLARTLCFSVIVSASLSAQAQTFFVRPTGILTKEKMTQMYEKYDKASVTATADSSAPAPKEKDIEITPIIDLNTTKPSPSNRNAASDTSTAAEQPMNTPSQQFYTQSNPIVRSYETHPQVGINVHESLQDPHIKKLVVQALDRGYSLKKIELEMSRMSVPQFEAWLQRTAQ